MDNQTQVKKSVNYAFKIVGYLGPDNKLFDRTCPTCQKGMYSSREVTRCPKCGGALGYITSGEGKPMAISEGTIYPAFGPKQEKRDLNEVSKRKNGMAPMYRFKMFNFMDETGVLTPPPEHDNCRKGAKVEILTMGHQLVPSWFLGKDQTNPNSTEKVPRVELLIMVYTNYGDYVKVLTEQQYASQTIHHAVNPDGSPAPIDYEGDAMRAAAAETDRILELERQINILKAERTPPFTPQPVATPPAAQNTPPWEGPNQTTAAAGNIVDPFANAK
jgi:hypothetical protein